MVIRSTHRSIIVVFIAAHFVLAAVVNLIFFAGNAFRPLASATGGLLTGSLLVNLAFIGVLIGWVMLKRGNLRPYDVGLIPSHIMTGIAYTIGLWGVAQVIHLLVGLLAGGTIAFSADWLASPTYVIGLFVAQIFGNALFEEVAYRGFLFPQLYLRLGRLRDRPWMRLAIAILISQGVFALSHIPNRIYLGMSAGQIALDLVLLLAWGILYTLIYLKTDNLFLVVGVHALGNAPTTLFAGTPLLASSGASFVINCLAVLVLFGLPMVRAYGRRFGLHLDYGLERGDYAQG